MSKIDTKRLKLRCERIIGAPIKQIVIEEEFVKVCIEQAEEDLELMGVKLSDEAKNTFIKQYTIASIKKIYGRIIGGHNAHKEWGLDGEVLLNEGINELKDLIKKVKDE